MAAQNASEAAWDGNAASYPDADSYCAACLMDTNPAGQPKAKGKCHLPVFPPGGSKTPNRTAMGAAAAALAGARGGVSASAAARKKAAKKLLALYQRIGENPPASLKTLAQ